MYPRLRLKTLELDPVVEEETKVEEEPTVETEAEQEIKVNHRTCADCKQVFELNETNFYKAAKRAKGGNYYFKQCKACYNRTHIKPKKLSPKPSRITAYEKMSPEEKQEFHEACRTHTIAELVAKYKVTISTIYKWKKLIPTVEEEEPAQ